MSAAAGDAGALGAGGGVGKDPREKRAADDGVDPDAVEFVRDPKRTKQDRSVEFMMENEGHTLGQIIHGHLSEDPQVAFSGYEVKKKKGHATDLFFKVTTSDGSNPYERIDAAARRAQQVFATIRSGFKSGVAKYRAAAREGAGAAAASSPEEVHPADPGG